MQLPNMDLNVLMKVLAVLMQVGLLLLPVVVAFLRKNKNALSMLLEALPAIYDAVEQERRKNTLRKEPLARAKELATAVAGRRLRANEAALVETRLRAIHEMRHHGGPGPLVNFPRL